MIWDETTDFPKDNWCLKIDDENRDIVNNWRINIIKYSNIPCFYDYINWEGRGTWVGSGWVEWILISTSQFKKYVLNMEEEIEIGDIVRFVNLYRHNSSHPKFNAKIGFEHNGIGNQIEILNIEDVWDELAYTVKCNLGITYLRRDAFELISKKKEIINQDMGYLKELFEKLNIK